MATATRVYLRDFLAQRAMPLCFREQRATLPDLAHLLLARCARMDFVRSFLARALGDMWHMANLKDRPGMRRSTVRSERRSVWEWVESRRRKKIPRDVSWHLQRFRADRQADPRTLTHTSRVASVVTGPGIRPLGPRHPHLARPHHHRASRHARGDDPSAKGDDGESRASGIVASSSSPHECVVVGPCRGGGSSDGSDGKASGMRTWP